MLLHLPTGDNIAREDHDCGDENKEEDEGAEDDEGDGGFGCRSKWRGNTLTRDTSSQGSDTGTAGVLGGGGGGPPAADQDDEEDQSCSCHQAVGGRDEVAAGRVAVDQRFSSDTETSDNFIIDYYE